MSSTAVVMEQERAVAPPPEPVPVRQRRRPLILGLGVALIATGVLAGAWYGSQTNQATEVLILQTDMDAGDVLTRADLRSSAVTAGTDVAVIPVADVDQYTGQRLTGNLPANTVLTPGMFADRVPMDENAELVGVAFRPSQVPATGVRPGDQVTLVVAVGVEGATPPLQGVDEDVAALTTPGQTWAAEVAAVSQVIQDDGSSTIDLFVPTKDATAVAAAAGSGDLALVLRTPGQE